MEISIIQALLIGILSYAGSLSSVPFLGLTGGWYILSRPIVSGLLVGLILGDVTTGILVGVAVQVVFIAIVTPGGAMPQDLNSAAYIGVTLGILAVKGGTSIEVAVTIATAVGIMGSIFHNLMMKSNSFWNHKAIASIEKGDYRGLIFNHFVGPQLLQMLYRIVPTAVILYFGAGLFNNIISILLVKPFIIKTLTALGGMLPAVGIAILLRQVTKKNVEIIYFLFGFTLIGALKINMISLAIIGAFFALVHFKYTEPKTVVANGGSADLDDEEEDDDL